MIIKDVIDSHIKSFFEYIEQRKLKIGDFLSLIYKAFYYIKMTETKKALKIDIYRTISRTYIKALDLHCLEYTGIYLVSDNSKYDINHLLFSC